MHVRELMDELSMGGQLNRIDRKVNVHMQAPSGINQFLVIYHARSLCDSIID
jgi:hypothetical protein